MMDGVDLPNDSGNAGKWRIWMPDGTTRMVKGGTSSGVWITARCSWQVHGRGSGGLRFRVLPRRITAICTTYPPQQPCGLSRVQRCERAWRCIECACESRCLRARMRVSARVWPSAAGSSRRQASLRQVDKRGGMTGRVKRQSGSEATKRPVSPCSGNTVLYGRQPVEKIFVSGFCTCLLNNNL